MNGNIAEKEDKGASSGGEIVDQLSMPVDIGDGGESGHIVPGKSVAFATLEVCLCVLVRHMPALNPSIPSTGFQISSLRQTAFSEATNQLLAVSLQIMTDLPMLCSPAGEFGRNIVMKSISSFIYCNLDEWMPVRYHRSYTFLGDLLLFQFLKDKSMNYFVGHLRLAFTWISLNCLGNSRNSASL